MKSRDKPTPTFPNQISVSILGESRARAWFPAMSPVMLVLWVLFTAAAAGSHPIVAGFERFYANATDESRLIDGGLLLLNELNCVACHAVPESWRERVSGRGKISLAGVGGRLERSALRRFSENAQSFKPGTTMPVFSRGDEKSLDQIADYLRTLRDTGREFPSGDVDRGAQIFERVGCVACHAPPRGIQTAHPSIPIGLAQHYTRNALAAFLQDPLHARPAGRMPATELSDVEAADLAAYLNPKHTAGERLTPGGGAVAGRAAFAARGCAACHETGAALNAPSIKALVETKPGLGCLAETPAAGLPDFSLSATQTRALKAALRAIQTAPNPPALTAEQRVTEKFEQLNCYACHEWRGRGGVEPARAKFFTASDAAAESLGELGHLPPKLDQAGRKLTTVWLEKLLSSGDGSVRPYMATRMPRFGAAAATELVPLLAEACRPKKPQEIDVSGGKGHQRFATGRALLGTGTGGLGCVACHGIKNREPAGVRAINLTHTAQRLRPEYFKALLLDPQGVQPGTIMPPLLATRKDADKEIESIWTYFKELDQSNVLPDGLAVAGSFELKPQEEGRPNVFRTFLEGAGTQAIAVGFPAGVHAAFDAFEVRWALVWRGRFLDAQSNWEERPMKPIKALGDAKRMLPPHLPLAKLRDASEAWPTKFGAYAGYIFKGYRMAEDGTPTFRYEVAEMQIEDTVHVSSDGTSLRRTFIVRGGGDATGWYFRGVANEAAPQPLQWRNGVATFEETIEF